MKKKLIILGVAVCLLALSEMDMSAHAANIINFIGKGRFACDNLTSDPSDDVIFDIDDLNALADSIYAIRASKDELTSKVTTLQGKVETLKETCR